MKHLRAFVLPLFILFFNTLTATPIPLTIEIAETDYQRLWGLMKRDSMPPDHGMLFCNPVGYVWMFNTNIDLSIAFLDSQGSIIEIHEMKAYPHMMDPHRPVNSIEDFQKYPRLDRIFMFFVNKSKPVPKNAQFLLEMNKNWFKKHHVKIGNRLTWHPGSVNAYIIQNN